MKIETIQNKGIHIFINNGVRLLVQWGTRNRCPNRGKDKIEAATEVEASVYLKDKLVRTYEYVPIKYVFMFAISLEGIKTPVTVETLKEYGKTFFVH